MLIFEGNKKDKRQTRYCDLKLENYLKFNLKNK